MHHAFKRDLIKHVAWLKNGSGCASTCTHQTTHYVLQALGSWLLHGPGDEADRQQFVLALLREHAITVSAPWWTKGPPLLCLGQGTSQQTIYPEDLQT